jgi:hypothetical protein
MGGVGKVIGEKDTPLIHISSSTILSSLLFLFAIAP